MIENTVDDGYWMEQQQNNPIRCPVHPNIEVHNKFVEYSESRRDYDSIQRIQRRQVRF